MGLRRTDSNRLSASLCREIEVELLWTAEEHHVAGAHIELRCTPFRAFYEWRIARIEIEKADIVYRWKLQPSSGDRFRNTDKIWARAKLQYGLRKGETLRIRMLVIPNVYAGTDLTLSIWSQTVVRHNDTDQSVPYVKASHAEIALPTEAGPVERLSVYSHPMENEQGKVRTMIVPEDQYGNPTAFSRASDIQLKWNGKAWVEKISGTLEIETDGADTVQSVQVMMSMDQLSTEETISNGVPVEGGFVVAGNAVVPKSMFPLRPGFGEIHWHTDYSGDGQRSLRNALLAARDALNMSFASPGDHNPKGQDWEESVATLDELYERDKFVTMYSWENSTNQGHENYYFLDPDHDVVCGGKAGFQGGRPDKVNEKLRDFTEFFAVPHHTNSVAETRKEDDTPYWYPYNWTEPEPYIRLVEIMQTRGNQERNSYPSDRWRGWHNHYGASVQDALALGYRVGFTGGSDNHCGWPGRSYARQEGGGVHAGKSVILTGSWCKEWSRDSLYEALYNRHTWAVWDTRAVVWFTVGGTLMGGETTVQSGTHLQAELRIAGEDAWQSLEIISEGRTVWAGNSWTPHVQLSIPLGAATASTHYYVRGLQRNGGIMYASPVFVDISQGV